MIVLSPAARACDTCGCTLARSGTKDLNEAEPWFFDFTFEEQRWQEISALAAHELHESGHHVHDKTHEEFYHFTLGATPREELTFLAELPYVTRESIVIEGEESEDTGLPVHLGEKDRSEGLGDLNLTGIYRFYRRGEGYLGAVGGVKLPTGATKEKNLEGNRFEPELQPGTGSYDYTAGLAFLAERVAGKPLTVHGNVLYVIKTEGAQDFEAGDLFSAYVFADLLCSGEDELKIKVGADANLQVEGKQTENGVKMADSGGTTLFLGPSVSVGSKNASVFANFLVPVYQNLGGVHQEADYIWNAGAKISW
jgi:hypothetical protein